MLENRTINFTKQNIEQLPTPSKGKSYYKDSREKGLSLYVTSYGVKTFFIRKRIKGRDERIIIGPADIIPVEKARKEARILKGQIAEGLDPVAEKKKELSNKLTFGEQFKEYIEVYSKPHKKSWQYDVREVPKYLSHWFKKRMIDITRYDVQKIQKDVFENHGVYQANRIVERISSIYNKAIEWGWEGINPASRVKKYKEKSRDRFILPAEMPCLIRALNEEMNETARHFIWMLLLAGARKTNTLQMRWEQINWEHKTWRIPDSKNGEVLLLPLVDHAMDILRKRKEISVSDWVFPSDLDPRSHFVNVKRAWKRVKQKATIYFWSSDEKLKLLVEQCRDEIDNEYFVSLWIKLIIKVAKDDGITLPVGLMDVRLHDVRRTFGSYQAIGGSSLTIIGKSLGHRSVKSTEVYARLNLDPVRSSIEKATNAMLSF
ncbi:site-specific integrase [Chitinophaga pendula]|uniref:tyrosine-type recombinase/integrase n=1 Tax=Chitinophaga TaxID=79328 RepID=UPI000BAE839A|nr:MULTISPECIES: site-specific integrase [Chitinophaga]ASZ11182.1 recombinase XerD [Chitinophaga sp. MD30]UCJ05822.1 site-specific integrase [Chitinophaga pendula]